MEQKKLRIAFAFLVMIMVNEFVRLNTNEKGYTKGKWGLIQNITAINTADKLKGKCTWICHNHTNYCKKNHVKLAKPYFNKIDPIYFGIINSLKSKLILSLMSFTKSSILN